MPEMVRSEWNEFVGNAVDEFLSVVRPGTPLATQLAFEMPRKKHYVKVFDLEHELRRPHATSDVRHLLTSYSMRLVAAGAAGGTVRCNDGDSTVDCEFILRPNREPHYRCVGHAPPHCYDAGGRSILCP